MGKGLKDFNFAMGIQSFLFRHTPLGAPYHLYCNECPTWNRGRSCGSVLHRSIGTFAFGQHDGRKPSLAKNSKRFVVGTNVRWPIYGIFHYRYWHTSTHAATLQLPLLSQITHSSSTRYRYIYIPVERALPVFKM